MHIRVRIAQRMCSYVHQVIGHPAYILYFDGQLATMSGLMTNVYLDTITVYLIKLYIYYEYFLQMG